jgi:hypothetical protein
MFPNWTKLYSPACKPNNIFWLFLSVMHVDGACSDFEMFFFVQFRASSGTFS